MRNIWRIQMPWTGCGLVTRLVQYQLFHQVPIHQGIWILHMFLIFPTRPHNELTVSLQVLCRVVPRFGWSVVLCRLTVSTTPYTTSRPTSAYTTSTGGELEVE